LHYNLAARDWNIILSESPSQEWHALFTTVLVKALSDRVFDLVFVFENCFLHLWFLCKNDLCISYVRSNGELLEKKDVLLIKFRIKGFYCDVGNLKNLSGGLNLSRGSNMVGFT